MTNIWFLYYVFVTLPLNLKAMHAYAGNCGGVNGTTTCCSGFQYDIEKQTCKPCKAGYNGLNCDIKCVYPSFGKDCQSACSCKEADCDHVEGCKKSIGKTVSNICDGVNGTSCCFGYHWDQVKQICMPCEVGYSGLNCTITCLYPVYGLECQSVCKCTKEDCDYRYGCKTQTGNTCTGTNGIECCHGYKWNNEETKCIQTQMPKNSTIAVDWKDYQNVSTDRKQSKLMIGIGVLTAVALFIVLAISYTYRLENSNKEIDSNIYYSIK